MFSVHSTEGENVIVEKIESVKTSITNFVNFFSGIKTYEVGKGKPPQTKTTRDSKPFTSDKKLNENFSPFFFGRHIARYKTLWKEDSWINYGKWLAAPRDIENFIGEKILVRKITSNTLIATYIPYTVFSNTLLHVLKLNEDSNVNLRFILGILNSKLIGWYFRKKLTISHDDTFPQIMIRDIKELTIPIKDLDCQQKMVTLVDQMLKLYQRTPKTPNDKQRLQDEIAATDAQIDRLVYALYGLTEEEIRIVEGET